MRTLLLCSIFCAGCFDSGLSEHDVDQDGVDLGRADLARTPAADMACAQQYTHLNGAGQTWTDCVPLGTYNSAQAMKACLAYAPDGSCAAPTDGEECVGEGIAYEPASGGWTVFVYAGGLTALVVKPGGDCTTIENGMSSWD
jgi:hypothetical protein